MLVLAGFFGLYLYALGPTLPPYRDAGEFTTSAYTLGVSHPPSYPLYILAGHPWTHLKLGNPSYSLSLLSALAGAGALAVLAAAAAKGPGGWAGALAAVLLLGLSPTYLSISTIPEMYSLTILFASALLLLAMELRSRFRVRLWYAAAFLYGLFLGNRTDLVLFGPALAWLLYPTLARAGSPGKLAARGAAFFALGLSIYLYLPVRSALEPWLDWNHPSTFSNLMGSLTRKSYGGTLDLLSKQYALGELFLPNLREYAAHALASFHPLGLAAGLAGALTLFRRDRRWAVGTVLAYLFAGPIFFFLANLPPNPHAMAIVEPHYVLSDLLVAFWAAEGLGAARSWLAARGRLLGLAAAAAAVAGAASWGLGNFRQGSRRAGFMDQDFVRQVFLSTPRDSILVAKKDVQIFSLWHSQTVDSKRPDLRIVAQGLAGSPWYQASYLHKDPGVRLLPLRDGEGWREFLTLNPRRVYATSDVELHEGVKVHPHGLVLRAEKIGGGSQQGEPWEFFVQRGAFRYDGQPDFFHSDLVESFSKMLHRLGDAGLRDLGPRSSGREQPLRALRLAWAMHPDSGDPPMLLGYRSFLDGDNGPADFYYGRATALFDRSLELTRRYRSLPDVAAAFRKSSAEAYLNWGVVKERLGDRSRAEELYGEAIRLDPNSAQAHYNLAVLYWGRDWARVVREMGEVLRIEPGHAQARGYLEAARRKLAAP